MRPRTSCPCLSEAFSSTGSIMSIRGCYHVRIRICAHVRCVAPLDARFGDSSLNEIECQRHDQASTSSLSTEKVPEVGALVTMDQYGP